MRIVNTSKHISIQHVSLNLIKLKQKSNFKFAILKLLPFSLEVGVKSPIHYSHDYKGLHPDHHSWNPNSSHSTLDTRLLCIRHFCSILPCSLCPFSELSPSCLHPKLLKVVSIPCLYQYYDNKLKDLNQGRYLTQVVHRFFYLRNLELGQNLSGQISWIKKLWTWKASDGQGQKGKESWFAEIEK